MALTDQGDILLEENLSRPVLEALLGSSPCFPGSQKMGTASRLTIERNIATKKTLEQNEGWGGQKEKDRENLKRQELNMSFGESTQVDMPVLIGDNDEPARSAAWSNQNSCFTDRLTAALDPKTSENGHGD